MHRILSCFVLLWTWWELLRINLLHLPVIPFELLHWPWGYQCYFTALGNYYGCLSAIKVTMKEIGKLDKELYSLSGKTSYSQISRSLEALRFNRVMIVSLWNLTGISAALLPSIQFPLQSHSFVPWVIYMWPLLLTWFNFNPSMDQ